MLPVQVIVTRLSRIFQASALAVWGGTVVKSSRDRHGGNIVGCSGRPSGEQGK